MSAVRRPWATVNNRDQQVRIEVPGEKRRLVERDNEYDGEDDEVLIVRGVLRLEPGGDYVRGILRFELTSDGELKVWIR